MRFREWLITEDIAQDSEAHGDVMYPSIAGDYAFAVSDPTEFWWLQWRWKMDKKLGRKFHNIDQNEFEKRKYVALGCPNMPDQEWKHQEDRRSALSVNTVSHLRFKKIGKDSKENKFLPSKGYLSIDGKLEKIFNDQHTGTWQQMASDSDWTKYWLR